MIDADFYLNEGGKGESAYGKRIANDIGLAEKTYVDFRSEAMQRVAALSPGMNSMLRTTCVATQLEGCHAPMLSRSLPPPT